MEAGRWLAKDTWFLLVLVDDNEVGVVATDGLGDDALQVESSPVVNLRVGDRLLQLLAELVRPLETFNHRSEHESKVGFMRAKKSCRVG